MYVERVLSINNGWLILTTQKEEEWAEAQAALRLLDETFLLNGIKAVKEAAEEIQGEEEASSSFIPYYLYNMYNGYLASEFGWTDILPIAKASITSQLKPKAIKNKVSVSTVEADAMQTEDFLTSLYVTIPYYYNLGSLEISVILIPTIDTVNHILALGAAPNHLARFPTEETCRAELAKFSSLTSQAPIVLAFFSPTAPEKIAIEDVTLLKVGEHTIKRTIEFAPEYYQAGVGLLSYFGEVLRQKDPNTKAKIRIEQDGRTVRLHIESPAGDIETIEKELDQYALVISNQAPPETLFEQRMHIMQLESRLEVAKVEIKNAHDLKQLTEGFYSQQVRDLKQQVDSLTQQVAMGLLQQDKVFNLMHQQNGSHERVQLALLAHAGMLFKDLLLEASDNQRVLEAITNLHQNLLSGLTTLDVEEQIKQALATVKQEKPGLLLRIYTQVEGAALKAGAGASLGWAASLIKHALPPQ